MQCKGIILKIATDLLLVLILLCQVRPFVTRRLVKEDNGRPVQRIYGTGSIGWQNSALDRGKFYDMKFTGGHPHGSLISIKLQSNFMEITPRCECSPLNLLHIFRTPFPKNTSGGLLLNMWVMSQGSFTEHFKSSVNLR